MASPRVGENVFKTAVFILLAHIVLIAVALVTDGASP